MNRWNIPDWLETGVRTGDKTCIYCGVHILGIMPHHGPRKAVATQDHIITGASIVSRENIARCCTACNSSKGTKKLAEWFESPYW
jgi:5-methylcytosine-specific restriction endonuclease McrA